MSQQTTYRLSHRQTREVLVEGPYQEFRGAVMTRLADLRAHDPGVSLAVAFDGYELTVTEVTDGDDLGSALWDLIR